MKNRLIVAGLLALSCSAALAQPAPVPPPQDEPGPPPPLPGPPGRFVLEPGHWQWNAANIGGCRAIGLFVVRAGILCLAIGMLGLTAGRIGWRRIGRREKESMFFFEKKNQQTFANWHPCAGNDAPNK